MNPLDTLVQVIPDVAKMVTLGHPLHFVSLHSKLLIISLLCKGLFFIVFLVKFEDAIIDLYNKSVPCGWSLSFKLHCT